MTDPELAASLSVTFTPVEPFTAVAGRMYFGRVRDAFGAVRMLTVWMEAVTDRRVARRIARRTGLRFSRHADGTYQFRGDPQPRIRTRRPPLG